LPEDLRGDETLANYKDIPDLAKAHVEIRKWATGRVAIPKADDAEGFAEFAGKLRPADAAAYKITDANGQATDVGESFRSVFHDAGLHPLQAEKVVAGWNQYQADQMSKMTQAGKDELTAIELEMGPQAYNQRLSAVDTMLKNMGIEVNDLTPALEQVSGAGKAMKALFAMAEKTGELAKVDSTSVALRMGAMTKEAAQAELDAMAANREPAFQKALTDKSSSEYAKRRALMTRIAQG
jgi:hypothetical protein